MVQQPVQPFNEEFKLNISVAEKLKTTRNDLSLSQARVASETGLRRSSISEAENGQRILTDDELNTLVDFYVQEGADPDFFNCDYSDDLNGEAEFSVTQCDGVLCAHSVAADVGLLESYANALADAENNVIKLLEAPVPSRRPLLSERYVPIDSELSTLSDEVVVGLARAHLASMAMQGRGLSKFYSGEKDVRKQTVADYLLVSDLEFKELDE